ncbi:hypothetical protein B6D52_03450 [Candidatus Parcubacteria bacterium 4484_255]|nr:MAG: hypothetical protein B6D52_03450 [Candidatus Parcubacteria bacterium 4484_255]
MIIKITVDRFEGDQAVLKTADNKTIVWPKNKLPKDAREGQGLLFTVTGNIESDEQSRQLAKDILNEILNSSD